MRYLALACDYDGTLASQSRVREEVVDALKSVLASGRRLVLVTGRFLDDLLDVFPHVELFDWVVAENGALLYHPATKRRRLLAAPLPRKFVTALRQRKIAPLSKGQVIVATEQPQETAVLEVIRDVGLELQVVFNKGAVMVLPGGTNKATGLSAALRELGFSPHNVVGIGDAENDHAFLMLCRCSIAVANAVPMLKEQADWVTEGENGAGVIELIERLLADDLQGLEARLVRHHVLLGTRDGKEVRIAPSASLLIAGPSGSGKSRVALGLLERFIEHGYQFCIVDPEGDYETFEGAVVIGNKERAPSVAEALQLLESPERSIIVNLLGLPLEERPLFFERLLPKLQELRARTGRPHWIVVDEAHHLVPVSWERASLTLPKAWDGVVLITVHPDQLSPAVLESVDTVIAVGDAPEATLASLAAGTNERPPKVRPAPLEPGEVLLWQRHEGTAPFPIVVAPAQLEHRRHQRKYAEGDLGPDKSFYFRGPEGKLNLRAQNLKLFLQIAEGVDDETWMHHLRNGDYARWFRDAIKDHLLAEEAERIEKTPGASPQKSRARIRELIEEHYILPLSAPTPEAS